MTKHTLDVKYDSKTGEHYLQFTPDMLAQVGWDFGDTLQWSPNEDGSWFLKKKEAIVSDNEKGNDSVNESNPK